MEWRPMEIDFVASKFHHHDIVPWAVEEDCSVCRYPASHKVTEDYTGEFHPYTTYLCCNHFWAGCRNVYSD